VPAVPPVARINFTSPAICRRGQADHRYAQRQDNNCLFMLTSSREFEEREGDGEQATSPSISHPRCLT